MKKILSRSLRPIHSRAKGVKFQWCTKVFLEKYSFENEKQILVDVWFPSISFSLHTPSQVMHHLQKAVADMMSNFDAFMQKGSGWVVRQVKMVKSGAECTSLPLDLKRT